MPLIYQFVAHHQPNVKFDPMVHMDKKVMFDKLLTNVGIILVLDNSELNTYRVTLKNSLTTPHSITSDPTDERYWLFDLDHQEWKYFDIRDIKHFEVEEW